MSCEQVREQLWTLPVEQFETLEPHLSGCPDCSALAAAIREELPAVQAGLDEFGNEADFRPAFQRARAQVDVAPSAARGGWKMFGSSVHWLATAAVAVATVGVVWMAGSGPEAPVEAPVEAPITTAPSVCGDLKALEPPAMLGKFSVEVIDCLEERVEADDEVHDSLLLLTVNAFSKGDTDTWEGYAVRLLEVQPDPDLAYKLALHNSKRGPEHAEDAILFADMAHEHRNVWTGDTYVSRVNNLFKIRASAALELWTAKPDDTRARSRTETYAREWLEYARAAGRDTGKAEQVCEAAAGKPCD